MGNAKCLVTSWKQIERDWKIVRKGGEERGRILEKSEERFACIFVKN